MVDAIYPILGAVLSRMHGNGTLPKVWMGLLWAVPFAYLVWTYNPWLAPIALGMCAMGKNTAHRQYFSLNGFIQKTKPVKLDFIVRWFFGEDPKEKMVSMDFDRTKHYWRCVSGLSVVGLAAVSGGLLIAPYNPLGATFITICGLCKPVGYMIGWKIFDSPHSTETGEYITGFFAYLPFTLIFLELLK